MSDLREVARRVAAEVEEGWRPEASIEAKRFIDKGALFITRAGILFAFEDTFKGLRIERWPLEEIEALSLEESLSTRRLILETGALSKERFEAEAEAGARFHEAFLRLQGEPAPSPPALDLKKSEEPPALEMKKPEEPPPALELEKPEAPSFDKGKLLNAKPRELLETSAPRDPGEEVIAEAEALLEGEEEEGVPPRDEVDRALKALNEELASSFGGATQVGCFGALLILGGAIYLGKWTLDSNAYAILFALLALIPALLIFGAGVNRGNTAYFQKKTRPRLDDLCREHQTDLYALVERLDYLYPDTYAALEEELKRALGIEDEDEV